MPKGIHDEHRKRMREEFYINGFSHDTPPHKIVEMMLYYSIPRKDTNEIAHLLMDQFNNSIVDLINARPEDIMKVKGVGENTAVFLKFIQFIVSYYINEQKKVIKNFNHINDISEFLLNKYLIFKNEVISILSIDNKGKFLGFDIIGEGDIASVGISTRQVVEVVLKRNATAIILAHNHPGGNALPSKEDIKVTTTLKDALQSINVTLLDHIILAEDDYVSLRQSHQFNDSFK